jgi:predicted amidophosphoribosyltransferase
MALQYLETGLPFPDLIIPVPSLSHTNFERGFQPTALLAATLSEILQRPTLNALKPVHTLLRPSDYPPDTRPLPHFTASPIAPDCNILLIDDCLVTGQSLYQAASALSAHYPNTITGLVFFR